MTQSENGCSKKVLKHWSKVSTIPALCRQKLRKKLDQELLKFWCKNKNFERDQHISAKTEHLGLLELTCCNRTTCNRHLCRKTTVLSCHRCLINTGVEKMNM